MSNFRTMATAAGLAGAAVLGLVATSAAQAGEAKEQAPWCTSNDLAIVAFEAHSPSESSKLHNISFMRAEGASCSMSGTLSNVRFLDFNGDTMKVPLEVNPTGQKPNPNPGNRPSVYVWSRIAGPQVTPSFIRFNLPGKGRAGDLVTIAWPSSLGAGAVMTNLMAPAS